MAGINAIAQTPEVALVAATGKTVIQIEAAANHRVKILQWGVFFDGISASGEPVEVELMRQTTQGTMTVLTAVRLGVGTETIQTLADHTATVEPTASDVLDAVEVHPQSGYDVIFPLGQELLVAGGGRVGIKCTAPAGVNVRAKIKFEE